jgi:hypothetical protein
VTGRSHLGPGSNVGRQQPQAQPKRGSQAPANATTCRGAGASLPGIAVLRQLLWPLQRKGLVAAADEMLHQLQFAPGVGSDNYKCGAWKWGAMGRKAQTMKLNIASPQHLLSVLKYMLGQNKTIWSSCSS